MDFDELNKLDYFEPMAISEEDKSRRRELAALLTDAFLFFFTTYEVYRQHNKRVEKSEYEKMLNSKISDAVSKVTGIDAEMSNHIRKLSEEVVDTTFRHTESEPPFSSNSYTLASSTSTRPELLDSPESLDLSSNSHFEDGDDSKGENEKDESEYWLSINRAINIAQNEANTFMNYSDFVDAKEKGYTRKTWLTMLDKKVRDTHEEVEGQTIGIDEVFIVGNSEMRFPHDWELAPDPKETVNCRCAIDYK